MRNLKVLLFLDEDKIWVAQCLDFDIAAQGSTEKEARQNMRRALKAKAMIDSHHNIEPFSQLSETPEEYSKISGTIYTYTVSAVEKSYETK